MTNKYICVHGHFYQPPRENPWLNKVEIQDSAYPYHDWNHRINAECYARNGSSRILENGRITAIMNNYAHMSFNVGPTLMAWMELEAPKTYTAILRADRESQKRFSGHGAALAQSYNHLIMPLANKRDRETQVIWGIEDFKSRFKRMPEGMWLSEAAVNTATLETLAENGIKFTILSPYQAKNVRKLGTEDWSDASDAKVDTRRAYVCKLPSGNEISLFFYDGPASQGVAFEGLLDDGVRFANRLRNLLRQDDEVELVNIATDGESYGHHHNFGEMGLSYCLDQIEEDSNVELTIYGEFLEKFPPEYEVEIQEDSSWSCIHGVGRWKEDCGCNTGGHDDWNQEWRAPLREAFDWVRKEMIQLYEDQLKNYTDSPWEVRNDYIKVVLNRDHNNVGTFLRNRFGKDLDANEKVKLLKLLEIQYHAMLMYTSCGWFFDEVTGIESVQDIFYATRALQLAEDITQTRYTATFENLLEKIPSNLPEYGNARTAYEKFVKPMELDMIRIGAHYAVSSLFEDYPTEADLYNFKTELKSQNYYESGNEKLVIGRAEFTSDITWEKVDITYAVMYMGNHHLFGGVRQFQNMEAFDAMHDNVTGCFKKGDLFEVFNSMDSYFENHNYSFWHLFRDEQRKIMELSMDNTLKNAEGALQQLYERIVPLMQTYQGIHMEVPMRLKLPMDMTVNNKLIQELKDDDFNLIRFEALLEVGEFMNVNLDLVTLNFLSDKRLNYMIKKFKKDPTNLSELYALNGFLETVENSPLSPPEWEAQNVIFDLWDNKYHDLATRTAENKKEGEEWIASFDQLVKRLNIGKL